MRVKKPFGNAALSQATVLLGFDYSTSTVIQMSMESLAIVNIADVLISSTTSAQRIKAIGSLELKQESPLRAIRGGRNLYNDNLFQYLEHESLDTFLSQRYFGGRRNETTNFNHETFIQRGVSSQSDYVDIMVIVNIPSNQQILYAP